jgi:hypothetical protein
MRKPPPKKKGQRRKTKRAFPISLGVYPEFGWK